MYFEELLKKVSEPADLAVFFLGFAVGFILDLVYFTNGVPGGTIAGVIAILFLGIKNGIEAYLLGSSAIAKRRRKRKFNALRRYFLDNTPAIQLINDMENILQEQTFNCAIYEQILDQKLQNYMMASLQKIDELKEMDRNIYVDLRKLYDLAKSPEENVNQLKNLCHELEKSYFRHEIKKPSQRRTPQVVELELFDS